MNTVDKKLSKKALEKIYKDATEAVVCGSIYFHYKNPEVKYVIVGHSISTETLQPMVIYGELAHDTEFVWSRPVSQWFEKVEVDGQAVDRFTFVGNLEEEDFDGEEDFEDEEECQEDCNGENCK